MFITVPDPNVCVRGKFTGPCRAAFRNWYWDMEACECKRFIYGGCQSNGNNFETKEACTTECGNQPCAPGPDVCLKPKHKGPCYADFSNWYWNKDTCKCERFAYGGCESNGNNFQTEVACMEKCGETPCEE